MTTWRMAADGTASIAPMMPSSEPPMSSAMMTVTALTPTCRRHDLRHQEVVLDLLLCEKEDQHEQPGLRRDGEPDCYGGNGGEDRADDRNHLAERGDQRQHVEVRDAQRVQTDGGADADGARRGTAARSATR